ncbi:hypothetical protein IFT91_24660 [Pseudomonas fluorescens]|nr:hypothetical protein [Pseudomonas fluorescens]
MNKKKYRVVHCGTGPTGIPGLRGIVNHPDLELIGHLVFDPVKDDMDSGQLGKLGRDIGIKATRDVDALIALKPDYFCYLGDGVGQLQNSLSIICRFLEAGVNVGTAALFGTLNWKVAPAELREPIEKACIRGNSSYYFSGIDPGFASPWLAVAMLQSADEVSEIRMQELSDYAIYPVEWVMREVFGFGKPRDFKCALSDGSHIARTWTATVNAVANRMGIVLEDRRVFFENCTYDKAHNTFWGQVDANTVAAVRFGIEGIYKGKPFIVLEHINRTTDNAAPHWPKPQFEPGKELHHQWTVLIKGNPDLACRIDTGLTRDREDAGLAATAMTIVNAARSVIEQPPGIIDAMDLPLYTTRSIVV